MDELERVGDEIIACGRLFHAGGARVRTWLDPGGYDGYSAAPRFHDAGADAEGGQGQPLKPSYSQRRVGGTPHGPEPWSLSDLQEVVDQTVIHFDACGSSRRCFEVRQISIAHVSTALPRSPDQPQTASDIRGCACSSGAT